ncbi:uncharacterized protein BJ212DRAFT_1488187 [Suillus subaureus]|uniref:Uncharacterized protein n=1 Tax=Suillus subaureus TaxID=48587 RepID=A0A9P7DPM5_9AGAM|nr:uncharacterized protein BJ212DRAFT_1488187 [Suillus subaureus]KAG1799992.1 hypothetical protein BJ212DRAFT_1488187 [Suillus subaureus]
MSTGRLEASSGRFYNAYLKASSYRTWFMLGILIACSQSLGVIEKLWVRQWGQAYGDGAELGPHIMAPSVLTENEALNETATYPTMTIDTTRTTTSMLMPLASAPHVA